MLCWRPKTQRTFLFCHVRYHTVVSFAATAVSFVALSISESVTTLRTAARETTFDIASLDYCLLKDLGIIRLPQCSLEAYTTSQIGNYCLNVEQRKRWELIYYPSFISITIEHVVRLFASGLPRSVNRCSWFCSCWLRGRMLCDRLENHNYTLQRLWRTDL